ncbi:MAG TPA: class I SAM-dependent methyltransferase [Candidatus Acidoferrales bacterium]|nr:class I SAM-dependent methyltransferase [Candidatus Acidoferrales bacterium]
MSTAPYIMEHPAEGQRLLDKADAPAWISKFLERHLSHTRSLLSVGCGPGVFLRELAESHPEIEVVGVDASPVRIQQARQRLAGLRNARACVGDALALPFEANRFDLVFCRFLLEYLPDKLFAVREMARVCSDGGKILLQDLDGQLLWHFPEDDELRQTTERVVRSLEATGFDPFVGRKLFSLCCRAALAEIDVQLEPYHLYAGSIDAKQFSHWQAKLEIALPQVAAVLGSERAARDYSERFLAYLQNPETLTYSCLFTVTATKP